MHPILLHFGPIILPSWHFFFVLGSLVSWVGVSIWRKYSNLQLDSSTIDLLFLVAYIPGYFGARGFSIVIERSKQDLDSIFELLFTVGSMTLYGGLILGSISVIGFARLKKIPLLPLADLILPPTLMGVGIGRIGCFLNGDDFGIAVKNQLKPPMNSVIFPNLGDGIYRYPVQIWESMFCFFLVFLCWLNRRQIKEHPGLIGTSAVLGYGMARFGIEFFRGDDRGLTLFAYLSPAQVISLIIVFSWGIFVIFSEKNIQHNR